MKHLLAAAFVFLALLGSRASAEVLLPTYGSYAGEGTKQIALSENADTATAQYDTDSASLEAYQSLLLDQGFLLNGQWSLPGGEGYAGIRICAYTLLGDDAPSLFRMNVGDDSVACHILLQTVSLDNGRLLVAITRSAGIGTYTYVRPTPTPVPTPQPTPSLEGDDGDVCSICNGRGVVRCGICRGSGVCPTCNGKRRYYVTSYGAGPGSYVDCQGCHGSGKCWRCNGSGTEDCQFCDGGHR